MEREPFDGENQPRPTPVIEIDQGEGLEPIRMHWFNTVIRLFVEPEFNHVEYRPNGDDSVVQGISVTQEFMDLLFEKEFPQYSLPYVDEATYNWYVDKETRAIDDSIAGFEQSGELSD